jgi:hypothetical protein
VRFRNQHPRTRRSVSAAVALAAIAGSAFLPASAAEAYGPVDVIGPPEVRSIVETFLVPTLPHPVRIVIGACPDGYPSQGCHTSGSRMDTIWLDPSVGGLDTETTAHEMGHVFESYMWNLRWERRQGTEFVPKIFGRIASVLFGEFNSSTLETDLWSEQFAESYSACARLPELSETITGFYGFQLSPEQHALICPMIDEMGQRYEEASKLIAAEANGPRVRFRRNDTIGPLKR